ncbi:MAG: beta-ketoacyl-ACP synthase [Methylococcaceae bacterium]|nr:beta-ketoacyl-ACP synthase [Methylococcaceae bacterium]
MTLYLNDLAMLSAVGANREEIFCRVQKGDRSGLFLSEKYSSQPVFVGEIQTDLPEIESKYSVYNCKNNQLLLAALSQIQSTVDLMIKRYGLDRIGVVLGTSTSGVRNTELALTSVAKHNVKPDLFHYKQQQLGAGADFLAHILNLKGPAYAVSTACSSSGKAFASARRLINLGFCDAVIVGGADTLCRFTVHGFDALASVSDGLSKPFGKHRDGINLSEAVALFVMSKDEGPVKMQGIGASSDAYHFSAPDPKGSAVISAMLMALAEANKAVEEIDYINLHGTATPLNDAMESHAVNKVFGHKVAVSSTKGMTGHALGAAAALELGLCWMLLSDTNEEGLLVPNINEDILDDTLPPLYFVKEGQKLGRKINSCQSNSFAFGGNNVSLVVERT